MTLALSTGKSFFSLIFAQNIGVVLYAGPHYTREYTVSMKNQYSTSTYLVYHICATTISFKRALNSC